MNQYSVMNYEKNYSGHRKINGLYTLTYKKKKGQVRFSGSLNVVFMYYGSRALAYGFNIILKIFCLIEM